MVIRTKRIPASPRNGFIFSFSKIRFIPSLLDLCARLSGELREAARGDLPPEIRNGAGGRTRTDTTF
jgi:hypothetical protein